MANLEKLDGNRTACFLCRPKNRYCIQVLPSIVRVIMIREGKYSDEYINATLGNIQDLHKKIKERINNKK